MDGTHHPMELLTKFFSAAEAVKTFENQELKLSITIGQECEKVDVGGVTLCTNIISDDKVLQFTCSYELKDQTITSANFDVKPSEPTDLVTAESSGTINYELILDEQFTLGDNVNFEIVPKTVGVVYATVKSCEVKTSEQQVSIFGYNDKPMCFLEALGASWNTAASSREKISGQWRSFQ